MTGTERRAGRATRRPRRGARLALFLALALPALAPGRAESVERLATAPDESGEGGLVALALANAPLIFDTTVQLARSFVAVTYEGRGMDPVTGAFVVRGLRLARAEFALDVGRLRIGPSSATLDGLVLDTRTLPLDPEIRAALRDLDSETVRADVTVALTSDLPSASFDLDVALGGGRVGRLDLGIGVDGFHVLVPLDEAGGGMSEAPPPEILGALRFLTLDYRDAGLADALVAAGARSQGLAEAQMREAAAAMAAVGVEGTLAGLRGGDDPRVAALSGRIAEALAAFVREPDRLAVLVDPAEPVPLALLAAPEGPSAETVLRLEPRVSAAAVPAVPLLDPAAADGETQSRLAGPFDLSRRLVEGVGLPQDAGRAYALLADGIAAGEPEALRLAARALALDPSVETDSAALAGLAAGLLVVRAMDGEGTPAEAAATDALLTSLDPGTLLIAETEAAAAFADTPAGAALVAREEAALSARDFAAVRRLAFEAYEGRGVPRLLWRAEALASVAAAGGDALARALRDDLGRAAAEGRVRFDRALAREEADRLWTLVLAGRGGEGADEGVEGAPVGDDPAVEPPAAVPAAPPPGFEPKRDPESGGG